MKKLIILIILISNYLNINAQNNLDEAIPFDASVRKGVLPNGLTYFIKKNTKPEKRAELRLAINVGATQEDDNQQGLAHFVEHLCFNGTKNFKKSALVDYLESIGTKFGAHLNAYTSFDETVYQLQLPTDDAAIFEKGFLVLEDWAHNVSFDNDEIEKERGVVISERRNGLGAFERINEKLFPIVMNNARYAERLPIGKLDVLEKATPETIKKFYKDWYRPNLMSVIAVGDFDVDLVEKAIKNHFAALTNPTNQRPLQSFEVKDHDDVKSTIATDKELPYNIVEINIKHQIKIATTKKDWRSSYITKLCNQMLNARLGEITAKPDAAFSYGGAYYGSLVRTKNSFNMYCITQDNGTTKAMEALLTEAERAKKFGFVEGELEQAKKEMLKSEESAFLEKDKTESGDLIDGLVYYFLEKRPFTGIENAYNFSKQEVPSITLAEVNEKIKSFLTNGKNTVLQVSATEKKDNTLPDEIQLINIYNNLKSKTLEPYKYEKITKPLMEKKPTEGRIVGMKELKIMLPNEKNDSIVGVEYEFTNGAKAVLVDTKFKNDEIQMSAYSWGGTSNYGEKDIYNTTFLTNIIQESGIGDFSKTELQKILTGKNVSVYPTLGELQEGINGGCSQADFETMLQLTHLYITKPRKDTSAFKAFLSQSKTWLANKDTDPETVYYEQSNYEMYNKNYRDKPLIVSDLDKINLDRVYQIYDERFRDGADFTYFFIGDFSKQPMLLTLLQTYIGSLPNDPKGDYWKDTDHDLAKGKMNFELKKGTAPKATVQLIYNVPVDFNRSNRAEMNALKKLLEIKLREVLREDKSGTYGVRVQAEMNHYPDSEAIFTIEFGCDPARQAELTTAALAVIESIKKDGCDEKNLIKIHETQRRSLESSFLENDFWLYNTVASYKNHTEVTETNTIEKIYKYTSDIKGGDFKRIANMFLNNNTLKKSVLKPEVVKP